MCVVSIYRVPKMYSISLSDVSCTSPVSPSPTASAIILILLGSDVEPCVWSVVEVDVAIVCACLPTFRPLFDRKVRRTNKRDQSVELATDHSFAPPNRRSGYENVEAQAKNQFLDLVRKNWAAVPSLRNSLEWRTSSRADYGMERRSAGGANDHSSAVEEWHAGPGGDERNESGDSISK